MNEFRKFVAVLNLLLDDELSAVNHYIVHARRCHNRDYLKLHTAIREHTMDQMHYAGWHVGRSILIKDEVTDSKLNESMLGKAISELVGSIGDDGITALNAGQDVFKLTPEVLEMGTADLLSVILRIEESCVDHAEMQHPQVEQIRFLS